MNSSKKRAHESKQFPESTELPNDKTPPKESQKRDLNFSQSNSNVCEKKENLVEYHSAPDNT